MIISERSNPPNDYQDSAAIRPSLSNLLPSVGHELHRGRVQPNDSRKEVQANCRVGGQRDGAGLAVRADARRRPTGHAGHPRKERKHNTTTRQSQHSDQIVSARREPLHMKNLTRPAVRLEANNVTQQSAEQTAGYSPRAHQAVYCYADASRERKLDGAPTTRNQQETLSSHP